MASIRKRPAKKGPRWQVRGEGIKTKSFTNKRDAQVYADEEDRRVRLGEHYIAAPDSFGAFLDAWLERQRKIVWRQSTYKKNKYALSNVRDLRGLQIHEVNRARVEDLVADIVGRGAPREAQVVLSLVKAVLRSAEGRKYRIDESVFRIKPPKYEQRVGRFLTLDELRELASYCPDYIYRLILVAGMTGLRQGELLTLKDHQLNLEEGWLQVERGKTENARRKIYLLSEVVSLLREQLVVRSPGTALVFPTMNGYQWNPNNLMQNVFRPAREAAGLDCTFHDLRHTFVSLAASRGMDRKVVGKVTGWSDQTVSAMFDRYRHVYPEEIQEAIRVLDEAVRQG